MAFDLILFKQCKSNEKACKKSLCPITTLVTGKQNETFRTYPLFSRVALSVDLPEYNLKSGDVATIVDTHVVSGKNVLSLEFFNAKGETLAIVVTEETHVEPSRAGGELYCQKRWIVL